MASSSAAPAFDTRFDAEPGRPVAVAEGIVRLTAHNAGPYTFTGTNTFLVGNDPLFVIDPGPDDDVHLAALQRAIGDRTVEAILITHTHRDHSGLARRLAEAVSAPLWFGGPHRRSRPLHPFEFDPLARAGQTGLKPDRTLRDGETLDLGSHGVDVIATPGHCANHLAFGISGTPHLFSGDHVMGWNSTLVATPDGSMADYLASLDRLIGQAWTHYLPAHGGPIASGREFARGLRAHRLMRNDQIVAAVVDGARSVGAVVDRLYPGVSPRIRRAAAMTVTAHIEYLEARGYIRVWRLGNWLRLKPGA